MTTTTEKGRLFNHLSDPNIRPLFISDHIREQIALQIRMMREKRQWTQSELGERADIPQSRISLLEDPDYSGITLKTLKRIADAFDVGLIVRFAPFSELVDWVVNLTPEHLTPPSYDEERQMSFAEISSAPDWPVRPGIPTEARIYLDASSFGMLESAGPYQMTVFTTAGTAAITPADQTPQRRRDFAIVA